MKHLKHQISNTISEQWDRLLALRSVPSSKKYSVWEVVQTLQMNQTWDNEVPSMRGRIYRLYRWTRHETMFSKNVTQIVLWERSSHARGGRPDSSLQTGEEIKGIARKHCVILLGQTYFCFFFSIFPIWRDKHSLIFSVFLHVYNMKAQKREITQTWQIWHLTFRKICKLMNIDAISQEIFERFQWGLLLWSWALLVMMNMVMARLSMSVIVTNLLRVSPDTPFIIAPFQTLS